MALAILLALTAPARAQVKPKIMIIFDTSGSMMKDSTGTYFGGGADGSLLCGGVGQAARIYQLKTALFEVLQGMGAQEIDFALATYPMMVDPTRTPVCANTCTFNGRPCSGHYYVTATQDSENTAGFFACKVSTHVPATMTSATCSDASNPCVAWYGQYKNEVLKVPFGQKIEDILWYFDEKEDAGPVASGPLTNPEIRAALSWYTPLGKSLFYAHGYFDKEVALPASDYRKSCEKLVIAFFTDGGETCNVQPGDAFYPLTWAANLNSNAKLKVTTHTVGIDIDAGSTAMLASIASAGKGTYYNVTGNTAALKTAFLQILAQSQPPVETCNGKDDDCDNKVDEDFPQKGQPCDNGKLGACYRAGTYVCKADGSGVVCNAPSATGTAEICNGIDDDCNGLVDDGLSGCTPPVCSPEVCNGKDDDCNNKVDDGLSDIPCGKDIGECKAGKTKCVGGVLSCDGGSLPTKEKCNGLDDDCDGVRDGFSEVCYEDSKGTPFAGGCVLTVTATCPTPPCCTGICRLGTKLCTAVQNGSTWSGVPGSCQSAVGPATEICDGLDNDCNGTVDDKAECPGGGQCIEGQCSQQCMGNEFVCPKGQLCKNGWCLLDPCDAAACEKQGWVCKGGDCIDPCKNVTCKTTELCVRGACVDNTCYTKGCPGGEQCVQGVCKADPCWAAACKPSEYCLAGSCLPTCEALFCKPDELCKSVAGTATCVKDGCAGVSCGSGQVCSAGKCITDPCEGIFCDKGQACVDGKCVTDPCEGIRCPSGYQCTAGLCQPKGVSGTTELLASGSGGLACTLAADSSGELAAGLSSLLILALGLLLGRRARRD